MNGIPWPSEVLELINDPLHAAFNSPLMLNWVFPLFAWATVAVVIIVSVAFWRAQWNMMMQPQRIAEAQRKYYEARERAAQSGENPNG
jgi:membrane protein insertase Oxa1/YidC/SpoIIIJ